MAHIVSDLLKEMKRRVDEMEPRVARRTARVQAKPAPRFPGEKQRPKLPAWPQSKPYVPKPVVGMLKLIFVVGGRRARKSTPVGRAGLIAGRVGPKKCVDGW